VQDADITDGNVFPDEVKVDLDMLCTLVLNGVGGEVDSDDFVKVDESALRQRSMELLNELPEPTIFSHVVGHGATLCLGAWAGDNVLVLKGLGDKVVVDEHNIARGGPTCIWATRPVCIHVDRQLRGGGGASQVEAKVQRASQIVQDELHHCEVRLPRIMHMEADLLDGIGDVGPAEHQVLEAPTRLMNWVRSAIGGLEVAETLACL
jgi:hypothetical protein